MIFGNVFFCLINADDDGVVCVRIPSRGAYLKVHLQTSNANCRESWKIKTQKYKKQSKKYKNTKSENTEAKQILHFEKMLENVRGNIFHYKKRVGE